ncbi:MAG: hypothetical protein GC189_10575 [Alphaproteobacteria bacterium]|nr:hypothetical protein [Alphaproteobacteria bacterium]
MAVVETRATALMAGHGLGLWTLITSVLPPPLGKGAHGATIPSSVGVLAISFLLGLSLAFFSLWTEETDTGAGSKVSLLQGLSAIILGLWLALFAALSLLGATTASAPPRG